MTTVEKRRPDVEAARHDLSVFDFPHRNGKFRCKLSTWLSATLKEKVSVLILVLNLLHQPRILRQAFVVPILAATISRLVTQKII